MVEVLATTQVEDRAIQEFYQSIQEAHKVARQAELRTQAPGPRKQALDRWRGGGSGGAAGHTGADAVGARFSAFARGAGGAIAGLVAADQVLVMIQEYVQGQSFAKILDTRFEQLISLIPGTDLWNALVEQASAKATGDVLGQIEAQDINANVQERLEVDLGFRGKVAKVLDERARAEIERRRQRRGAAGGR